MYQDSFVVVDTHENSAKGAKLDFVKRLLVGSFYTAKLDRHNSRDEIIVKVPNSINPVEELEQFFRNRKANCFVMAM